MEKVSQPIKQAVQVLKYFTEARSPEEQWV